MTKISSKFFINVLTLTSGSLIAQGLGVLILPILARLYTPEAIGISALFLSIASLIGVLACLRYELAIMLPKTNEEAANLLGVSLCATAIVTIITALVIIFAKEWILSLTQSGFRGYLWLIPVAVFINGTFLALNYWNSRTKHFGRLSIARITSSVAGNGARLGFGLTSYASGGMLIVAFIIGQISSTTILGGQIWRDDKTLFKHNIRWRKIIDGFKRHRKFPLYSSWSIFLNTASRQLPPWILAFFFSPAIVGFFAIGRLLLGSPLNLVGNSISQVFFQKASEDHVHTRDLSIINDVLMRLISLSICPFLLLTLIGKDVFSVLFGERWAIAGIFAQLLSLSVFFQFISSPITTIFSVLERQGTQFFFDTILFLSRGLALIIGGLTGNVYIAIFLYACAGILYYVLFQSWLHLTLNIPLSGLLLYLIKFGSYCLPVLLITAITKWILNANSLWIFIVGTIGMIFYYFIILKQDKVLLMPIQSVFQRLKQKSYPHTY